MGLARKDDRALGFKVFRVFSGQGFELRVGT